jgi:DNA polymerase V
MEAIRPYRPESSSLGIGQVLPDPYPYEQARVVLQEMAAQLAQDLMTKGLNTDQIVVTIGYDVENLKDLKRRAAYRGEVTWDHYGRAVPKHAHGTKNLTRRSSTERELTAAALSVYDRTVDPKLLIRRVNITANRTRPECEKTESKAEQLTLFAESMREDKRIREEQAEKKERQRQQTVRSIKEKYGKNAILTGTNFREGATARERNRQIGGHRA